MGRIVNKDQHQTALSFNNNNNKTVYQELLA
jgi:hypothetical protein